MKNKNGIYFTLIYTLLLSFSSPTAAEEGISSSATYTAGNSCTAYGTTLLETGGQNLLACLVNDTKDGYVWKSMTGGGSSIPAGIIAYFPNKSCPAGWIEANGQSTAAYASLASAVGTNVPDLRGYFVRSWDNGRGIDPSRVIASAQTDAIRNITGTISLDEGAPRLDAGVFTVGPKIGGQGLDSDKDSVSRSLLFDASRVVPTANEVRPYNIALLACISTGE